MQQTILVCDDEKEIVEAISIYLEGEGYKIIKAYDGLEALEILNKQKVDLVIIDVMMPLMDGFTLAQDYKAGTDPVDPAAYRPRVRLAITTIGSLLERI